MRPVPARRDDGPALNTSRPGGGIVAVDSPDASRNITIEAFADTILPGEKRTPDDRAIAGAAHLHTAEALAQGHPGLHWIGFRHPDDDGLFRFPEFSYGRQLAAHHPDTTPTGSPA